MPLSRSHDRAQPAALAPPCIGRAQLVQHRDGGGQVEPWHERRDALHPARRGWHTESLRALHGVPGRQAGRTDRCRESWGERGDTGTAGRGEGPMGELGAKGDRGAMVGDGAKVYVVLTLGLPVPTSTESESGAAAAERGDASRIACARPWPRGWVSLRSGQIGSATKAALALSTTLFDRRRDGDDSLVRRGRLALLGAVLGRCKPPLRQRFALLHQPRLLRAKHARLGVSHDAPWRLGLLVYAPRRHMMSLVLVPRRCDLVSQVPLLMPRRCDLIAVVPLLVPLVLLLLVPLVNTRLFLARRPLMCVLSLLLSPLPW